MSREVLYGAEKCPFCGATKIFLKAERTGGCSERRIRAAGQCSKCHVRGPFVYTTEVNEFKNDMSVLDGKVDDAFKAAVLAAWNTRA